RSYAMVELERRDIVLPPPTAPFDAAKAFVAERCTLGDAPKLVYWRDGWWQWTGTHWAERTKTYVENMLYEFTAEAVYKKATPSGEGRGPWLPEPRSVTDLRNALKAVCAITDEINPPCWLDGRASGTAVACRNGLLDLASRELLPHSPLFFNLTALPFDYD